MPRIQSTSNTLTASMTASRSARVPATTSKLRLVSVLNRLALGAIALRMRSISAAATYCSGTTRVLTPGVRRPLAERGREPIASLVGNNPVDALLYDDRRALAAQHGLENLQQRFLGHGFGRLDRDRALDLLAHRVVDTEHVAEDRLGRLRYAGIGEIEGYAVLAGAHDRPRTGSPVIWPVPTTSPAPSPEGNLWKRAPHRVGSLGPVPASGGDRGRLSC